jgi:hypothetical protein
VRSRVPLPMQMQMLAHPPKLPDSLSHSPTTPTLRVREISESSQMSHYSDKSTTPNSTADTASSSSRSSCLRRMQKSSSLSLRARNKEIESRKPTPERRARGKPVLKPGSSRPGTPPEHGRSGAASKLSLAPSVSGQQLASWFNGLLGRVE